MIKKIFLLLTGLISGLYLFGEPISLDQCIERGLNNGYKIHTAEFIHKNYKSSYKISIYNFLPKANVSAGRSFTNRHSDSLNSDIFSLDLNISKSLSVNEPTYFSYQKAKLDKQKSSLELKNTRKEFIYSILNSYLSVLQLQENIKIYEENLQLQKRIYEQVNIEYNNNKKTIYDLQSSQIDTLSSSIDLMNLKKDYAAEKENLFFLIGIKDMDYTLMVPELNVSEQVAEYMPGYSEKINQIELSKSNYDNIQSLLNLFPNLTVSYSYNLGASEEKLSSMESESFLDSHTYALNISYPLFSLLNDGESYKMQKRSFKKLKMDIDHDKKQREISYNQAVLSYKNEYTGYLIMQKKYDLSNSNMEIAENRFNLGLINSLELDKSRVQYLESKLNLLNKKFNLFKKKEEINTLVSGKILEKW